MKNILVMCTGNICRSPTAEYLLRQALGPDYNVANLIDKIMDDTECIDGVIYSSGQNQMKSMDQSLFELYKKEMITK